MAPEPSLMQEIGLCHLTGGIVAFAGEAKGSRATPETWQLPKAGAACIAMEGGECALKRESLSQPQPILEHFFFYLLKKPRPSLVPLSFQLSETISLVSVSMNLLILHGSCRWDSDSL